MQSFAIIASALLALTAHAAPTPKAVEHVDAKDAAPTTCSITADGVRFRACPSANEDDCPALGQYSIGQEVSFSCWTSDRDNTAVYWDKTADGQFVFEHYVDSRCAADLPECRPE